MEAEPKDAIQLSPAEQRLTSRELIAYQFQTEQRLPDLARALSNEMFQLFLSGKDCLEIVRLNKGITLGQIVQARIKGEWDIRRDEYLDNLLKSTQSRYQQAQLEVIGFAADGMAVYHRMWGDACKRFLQTGDPKDLGPFRDKFENMKSYNDFFLLMRTASGQEKFKGEVNHNHVIRDETPGGSKAANTVVEARATIKGLLAAKKGRP